MSAGQIFKLSEVSHTGLIKICSVVLPGTKSQPAANELEGYAQLLEQVGNADPRLSDIVGRVTLGAANRSIETFADLSELAGDDLERVIFALQAAYYMSEEVRTALNYPGQKRLPVSLATADQLCSDELIAPVIERGPIFVSTPDRSTN